jgi:hypothetical protein
MAMGRGCPNSDKPAPGVRSPLLHQTRGALLPPPSHRERKRRAMSPVSKNTPPRNRPGIALLDEERWAAILGDAVDHLETLQAPSPNHAIEAVIASIKFVRRQLAARAAEELAAKGVRP